MYNIEADLREKDVKAKNLRKKGITPCCLYGKDLDETILLQIPENEAMKMLREKDIGGTVKIHCNGEKYNALIKDQEVDIIDNSIVHIEFQNIKRDDVINGVARIQYINNNEAMFLVHKLIDEIPYTAKAQHIVENIVVDLANLENPTEIQINDLPIASDEDIQINIDPELVALNVAPIPGMRFNTLNDKNPDIDITMN